MQISIPCPGELNLVALEGRNMLCQQAPQVMECRWFMDCTLKTIGLAFSRPLINSCRIYECIWRLSWHPYFCQQRLLPINTWTCSPRRCVNTTSPLLCPPVFIDSWSLTVVASHCFLHRSFPSPWLSHCFRTSYFWLVKIFPEIQILFTPTQLLNHYQLIVPNPMLICIEDSWPKLHFHLTSLCSPSL